MISETLIIFLTAVMHLNTPAKQDVNSKNHSLVNSQSERPAQIHTEFNRTGGGGWDYN